MKLSNSVSGALKLRFEVVGKCRTALVGKFYSGPFHVAQPYWDGRVLQVQIANPTAGIFGGDRMETQVYVGSGASVLLTTCSATRCHEMRDSWAEVRGKFVLEADSWLEVFPELLIPQKGSYLRQLSIIHLSESAHVYFAEMIAPGRTARREVFAFNRLELGLDIFFGAKLGVSERTRIWPPALPPLPWESTYFANVWAISKLLPRLELLVPELKTMSNERLLLAATEPVCPGIGLKLLAADSLTLRKSLIELRQLFSRYLIGLRSIPRKL